MDGLDALVFRPDGSLRVPAQFTGAIIAMLQAQQRKKAVGTGDKVKRPRKVPAAVVLPLTPPSSEASVSSIAAATDEDDDNDDTDSGDAATLKAPLVQTLPRSQTKSAVPRAGTVDARKSSKRRVDSLAGAAFAAATARSVVTP